MRNLSGEDRVCEGQRQQYVDEALSVDWRTAECALQRGGHSL